MDGRYAKLVQDMGAVGRGLVELQACHAREEVMRIHARLSTRILSAKTAVAPAKRKIVSAEKRFDSAHAEFLEQWTQAEAALGIDSPYLSCLSNCKSDEAVLHTNELHDRRLFAPIIARMLNDSANTAKPLPPQGKGTSAQLLATCTKRIAQAQSHAALYSRRIANTKFAPNVGWFIQQTKRAMARNEAMLAREQAQEGKLRDAAEAEKVCVRSRFERVARDERRVAALSGKIRALVDGAARGAACRAELSVTSRPSKRARRSARAAESAAAGGDSDSDAADTFSFSSSSSSSDEDGLKAIYSVSYAARSLRRQRRQEMSRRAAGRR